MSDESSQQPPLTDDEKVREALILGHFIKYNLYLVAKSNVFAAIYANLKSTRDALAETNAVMKAFDAQPKKKKS